MGIALFLLLHRVGADLDAFLVEAALGEEVGLDASVFGGCELLARPDFAGAEGAELLLAGFFRSVASRRSRPG